LSGRGNCIPPNLFGALVATNEEPQKVVFVAKKNGREFYRAIDLEGLTIGREPKFLSENLVLFSTASKAFKYLFAFPRSRSAVVNHLADDLRSRLATPIAVSEPVFCEKVVAGV
jgi:hypothetical protein